MFSFEILIEIYLCLFTNIKQKHNEQQSFTFVYIDLKRINFTFMNRSRKQILFFFKLIKC